MRKPLKIYLFFLVLITAFGLLGNVLIQDEPNLQATDINTNIPGSETMVALYEPLAEVFGDDVIYDIAVMPHDERYDVDLLLVAATTDEQTLLTQTANVLQTIQDAAPLQHVTIEWRTDEQAILNASFTFPFTNVTAQRIPTLATAYTYTP